MIYNFVLLFISSLLIFLIGYYFLRESNIYRKTFYIILSVALFFFSGYGIIRLDNFSFHCFRFLVYFICTIIAFIIGSSEKSIALKTVHGQSISITNNKQHLFDKAINAMPHITLVVFIVYFLSSFIPFIYPSNRLLDLFRPGTIISDQLAGGAIFSSRLARQSNLVLSLASKLKLISFPFCLIFLNKKYPNKASAFLLFIVIDMYLSILSINYWGRIQLLKPFFFFIAFLVMFKGVNYKKVIPLSILLVSVLSIVFNSVFNWRQTGSFVLQNSVVNNISSLFIQETGIPNYYDFLISIHKKEYTVTFLKWLLNLLFPFIDFVDTSFSTSRIFSESYLGVKMGSPSFYVLLPGWLGESYLLFGRSFYFVGGMISGFIAGVIERVCANNDELKYYLIYLLWTLILYLRNNTQEFIAQSFNPLVGLIIMYCIYFAVKKIRSA